MEALPHPLLEEQQKLQASKRRSPTSKSVKGHHRISKRSISHGHPSSPTYDSHMHAVIDSRHKRVWKACERCRMKKTKCNGEFPCKRCKDDGLVCTAGIRKKTEYKQLPRGYAEVLENTQFALIATVHKLYSMLRNGQQWNLDEPETNDRGQPVVHDIASKLGCIRLSSDVDLPPQAVFPEDEAGLGELARQLEEQQRENEQRVGSCSPQVGPGSSRHDRASSSELDLSDLEQDYRRSVFASSPSVNMSPQSLATSYTDLDGSALSPTDCFPHSPPQPTDFPPWLGRTASMDFTGMPYITSGTADYVGLDLLNQGLLESNFGTMKPHVLSCPNPDVMMGMGDPMIYGGYDVDVDVDALRL